MSAVRSRRGCYPGTFDPPTLAHLAIAEAAVVAAELDALDFVLSHDPLGKPGATPIEVRAAVLHDVRASRAWMGVELVTARLIADVAEGYDVLVVGADKWAQIIDPAWYGGSTEARDRAVATLPGEVLVVPRPGHPTPPGVVRLDLGPAYREMSSSGARVDGRVEWMAPEAVRSGVWRPPGR